MPVIVVFTVSSSVLQSSPSPAVRATKPIIAFIADGGEIRRSRSPSAAKHPIRTSKQRPAMSLYRLPSTTGTSPRRRSSPADHRIVVQSRRRRDVQSATHLQFVSNRTTAVPVLRRIVPTNNMADWENPSVVHSYAAGIMSLQ